MTLSPALKRQLSAVAKATQKLSVPSPTAKPNFKRTKNIFLIRSATPELFKKCVRELKKMAPHATLHIVSHERDRELITAVCAPNFTFHAYTGGGNYSWENLKPLQAELLAAGLDTFVMLANNVYGYPHIADILYQLGAQKLHLFNVNERWYSLTRADLEFKTACSSVYQSICQLIYKTL